MGDTGAAQYHIGYRTSSVQRRRIPVEVQAVSRSVTPAPSTMSARSTISARSVTPARRLRPGISSQLQLVAQPVQMEPVYKLAPSRTPSVVPPGGGSVNVAPPRAGSLNVAPAGGYLRS